MFFKDKAKYPPPTHRDFDPVAWQSFVGTATESKIAQLALHIHSVHSRIRKQSKKTHRIFPQNREARAAVVLSLFNHFFSNLLVAASEGDKQPVNCVGEIIARRISGIPTSTEITPDEAISGFVDSARFPLFDLLHGEDKCFLNEEGDLLEAAHFHAHAGQIYQLWNDMWQDVDLRDLRPDDEGCLRYENQEVAWAPVLAAHRADRDAMAGVFAVSDVWARIPRELKRRYAVPRIKIKNEVLRFRATNEIPERVPLAFVMSNQLAIEISAKAMNTALPAFGRVTIREIVQCWEVLSMVASSLCADLQEEIRKAGKSGEVKPSSCVFRFRRIDLIKDLSQYTGITMGRVAQIVDAMTYKAEKLISLWGRPLIDVGSGYLQMFLAPLVMGRLNYPVKDWVRTGGGNLSEKGIGFEEELYEDVCGHISGSNHLAGWKVFKNVKLKVGDRLEEIDLLLVFGKKVVVIEAKNLLPCYEPHEVIRYFKAIREAVEQAIRKASGVAGDPSDLFRFCRGKGARLIKEDSDFEIIPLVVMYGPLGVGMSDWKCAVVDRTTLLKFLGNEHPSFIEVGGSGARTLVAGGPIYTSPESAEAMFGEYMTHPPVIERYKALIKERYIQLYDDVGMPSKYRLCYFELSADPEEVEMSKRLIDSRR